MCLRQNIRGFRCIKIQESNFLVQHQHKNKESEFEDSETAEVNIQPDIMHSMRNIVAFHKLKIKN